ncbi:MAG: Fur family transcriptional regulator [Rhizobiaceae bacterium]
MSSSQPSPSLTRNQELVLASLHDASTPLSAYTILDNLRGEGFRAPLQVYRALEKLIQIGLVHRLESLNSFVACQHSDCDHHKAIAFAICDSCDSVAELTDSKLSSMVRALSDDSHFQLENSIVELRGKCEACASGQQKDS